MDEPPQRPTSVQVLVRRARRLAADPTWLQRLSGFGLLGLTAVVAGFLLTPGIYSQVIPYTDAELGRPAMGVIKAQRDYNIPDDETTARKREEAVRAAPAVYDFDTAAAEEARHRLVDGFGLMRDGGVRLDKGARRPDPDLQLARAEFVRSLQVVADEATFLELARVRFATDVQSELERLVGRALRDWVVAERALLVAEGTRGITVRDVSGSTTVGERTVRSVVEIKDLAQVREELAGMAQDLPKDWTPAQKSAVLDLARKLVIPTLSYNKVETERRKREASEGVRTVVIQLKKGEKIIGDGERIEQRHLVIFRGIRAEGREEDLTQVRLGGALFAALCILGLFNFARGNVRKFRPTLKDLTLLAAVLLAFLALTRVSMAIGDVLKDHVAALLHELGVVGPGGDMYDYLIPFAAAAMLVRLILNSETAIVFNTVFAMLVGIQASSVQLTAYALVGGLVSAGAAAYAKDRTGLFRAGTWGGLANAVIVVCFAAFGGKLWATDTGWSAVAAFTSGALFTPILVMGVTPLVEMAFGYATDIKLLELANLNHPVLKELIVKAPGTYHHSIIIGSLVEAAAHSIHANPLLARVGAYYHDIGKGKNPLYFGENQKGENRHDKISPAQSAEIIRRHVTEGMQLALLHKLPKGIVDFIPQHHGTRLIGYFWHKAREEAARDGTPLEEKQYRYAGPKPQTREAALVMIADACEASAKSVPDPTPARLQGLVQKVINTVFADGQLDECELTLRDLNEIAKSYYRTLLGIYHSRPEYPASAFKGAPRADVVPLQPREAVEAARDIAIRDGGDQQPPVPARPSRPPETALSEEEEEQAQTLKRLGVH